MQPILDNTSSGQNGNIGNSLSWSHTLGAGVSLIIVALSSEWFSNPSNPYTSVTFNGIAMTKIKDGFGSGSHHIWTELWALWVSIPAAGTYTISATGITPNDNSTVGVAASFFSIKPQTAEATNSSSGNGTEPLTCNITTLSNKSLVLAAFGSQNGGTPALGASQTDVISVNSSPESSVVDLSYRIVTGPQTVTMSADLANPEGEAMMVASFAMAELVPGQMI